VPNIRQHIHLFRARKLKPKRVDILELVEKIRSGEVVTFSRFGDGEWSAVVGRDGENCDGHKYSSELQSGLKEALLGNPKYNLGMQYFAIKNMGGDIVKFLKDNSLDVDWWFADNFHDANLEGRLYPFIKLLRESSSVVIGPAYMRELDIFPITEFVEVPSKNCFDDYNRIYRETKEIAERLDSGAIFLFSASMASNVIIHNLYKEFGERHSFLDVGALWDIYLGKKSRGVYNENHWDDTIKKNLGEV
jgi:hypothetical protein